MRTFFIIIASLLTVLLWAATLFGSHVWILDLIAEGALYVGIMIIIHGMILCAYRSWGWVTILGAGIGAYIVIFVIPVTIFSTPLKKIPAHPDIFFMNTLFFNERTKVISDVIAHLDPVAVALVEPNPQIISTVAKQYGKPLAYHNNEGLSCAIFSHQKPVDAFVADALYPICITEFDSYVLIVAHPIPPYTPRYWHDQQLYFAHLADRISAYRNNHMPVLLVGDFNSSWFSATLRKDFSAYRSRSFLSWHGLQNIALAIDHLMGIETPPITTYMLPQMTSDHRAIVGFFADMPK